jgi:Holliday junction resolvasome RuvABC endonuclease subunit
MTTTPRVIGLDLSLQSTGVAGTGWLDCIRPGARRGVDRLHYIRIAVLEHVTPTDDLIVIEGPAYSKQVQPGHHEAAGLWWLIMCALVMRDMPVAVVPPSTLKKYATGRGNATKPDMRVELLTRTGINERDDNKVDAYWLAAMGLDRLGQPPVAMPAAHREALTKVEWPELVIA